MAKTVLKDIGEYKNKIISSLLSSKDFCKALLMDSDVTDESVDNLVYKQVFPYLYVDETQKEVLPYVCCEVKAIRLSGTIKTMQVIVWIYAHKGCMKYYANDYIGTRVDVISDIVERQLHDDKSIGIGKLNLRSDGYIFPNNKYYGRELVFESSDFKVKES